MQPNPSAQHSRSARTSWLRAVAFWSLLAAPLACNSTHADADSPATRPIAATTLPTPHLGSPEARAMWESLSYIASDELEGRGLGTAGLDQAAAFVAGNFHGAGLQPLPGLNGYFQRFELTTADSIAPETAVASGGNSLKRGEEFIPVSFSAEKAFEAPAVFVGYGITRKERNYDDYANVNVNGKVAIAWRFEPVDAKGKSKFSDEDWSNSAHLDVKAKNAFEHGAVALILMNPPQYKGVDSLLPFAKQFQGSTAKIPVLHVLRPAGEALLRRGTEDDPKDIEKALDDKLTPQSRELNGVTVQGKVALKRTVRVLKNVVGFLPGVGPHADEYVIVGAHYDHLGRGGMGSLAPRSTEIHNGADDNGSGTAAVIELAYLFGAGREHATPLPRSVVFVAFTAEEEGLIGSAHFVTQPPLPLDKVAAMLNLDMVGRIRNEQLFVGGSGTAASFDAILKKASEGLTLQIKDIGKGGLGPSDHMSFAMKKIPVLFFFSGLHEDYHRPTDKIAKINFDGMAEVVSLSVKVIHGLAEMPREQYVTAADAHSMSAGMGSGSRGSKVMLGVVPDYTGGEGGGGDTKGVRISGTSPGTPAEAAGLKEGDVLVGFGDKPIETLEDLTAALGGSKPGDHVKLKVLRNKNQIVLDVTLAERK